MILSIRNQHKCHSASFEYICYGSTAIVSCSFFQCRDRLYRSESVVPRCQLLMSGVVPHTEWVKLCPAELSADIFHSYDAGIPKEISSIK